MYFKFRPLRYNFFLNYAKKEPTKGSFKFTYYLKYWFCLTFCVVVLVD